MQSNFSVVAVPFPKGLMSTARSALTMPTIYARSILNMLMAADGAGTKRHGVRTVAPLLPGGETVVHLMTYAGSTFQLLAVSDAGTIYRLTDGVWESVFAGLNPLGTPRSVTFGGKLVLCNGYDALMAYNGTSWSELSTLVVDLASGLTWVSASSFKIASDAELYPVGTQVRAKVAGDYVYANVASVTTDTEGVVTVVLASAVLGSVSADLTEVAFTVKPPILANLTVAHDRLWGFGKGALSLEMSGDVDRLRVFYTYGVNNPADWPDPETGSIPSINLADKAGVADELLAMAVKDDITVFFGRNQLQLWSGSNPVYTATSEGDFAWSKTIPLGLVHGNAVVSLPNDLLFLTRTGARTLSRTVQTEQLDIADVGAELDPTFAEELAALEIFPQRVRQVCTFQEPFEGWFGLSLGGNTLVWQVGSFGHGWVVFTGAFAGLTAACTGADGTLYLGKQGQVYVYDRTLFADDSAAIATRWALPWVRPGGTKRWANKYGEVLMARGSRMEVSLRRSLNDDESNPAVFALTTPELPDTWDSADWDTANWDAGSQGVAVARDHAVGTSFAYTVETETTSGPFTVFGLKLYGVSES